MIARTAPGTPKRTCADALAQRGHFAAAWVARAFDAVHREAFVPDRVWWPESGEDGMFPVLDRTAEPEAWLAAVYDPHRPLITQVEDRLTPAAGPARGRFSSSVSAPDVVCDMLGHLQLEEGHTVLEIGTGSGYNAALLCERVGPSDVTTVEIDRQLAHRAEEALRSAGYRPDVRCADGERPSGGSHPYDRVIATASTWRIPYPWVEQVKAGGAILAPRACATGADGLLFLRADGDGGAAGRFLGTVSFMRLRGRFADGSTVATVRDSTWDAAETVTRETGPEDLADDADALFALAMRCPDLRVSRNDIGTWWLSSADATSWAAARPGPDGTYRVKRWGPRDLFTELLGAARWWRDAGRPGITRFGVTVTADGETVWLDAPGCRISPPGG
ncbi:methyltransferase domain-containing protein [Streptomyces sp. NPDC053079]|uniref:methyltransferase domain-containing protein n=1 Tax=Streptomyces sp. NPDC053079 TaxID=3365697 RepID=UPI0037D888DF